MQSLCCFNRDLDYESLRLISVYYYLAAVSDFFRLVVDSDLAGAIVLFSLLPNSPRAPDGIIFSESVLRVRGALPEEADEFF